MTDYGFYNPNPDPGWPPNHPGTLDEKTLRTVEAGRPPARTPSPILAYLSKPRG